MPSVLSNVAVRLVAGISPMFVNVNDTVTVSPISIVAFGGEKLSRTRVEPAATILGATSRTTRSALVELFVRFGSLEPVETNPEFVNEPIVTACPKTVADAVAPAARFPNCAIKLLSWKEPVPLLTVKPVGLMQGG